jgi:hypothetical protein
VFFAYVAILAIVGPGRVAPGRSRAIAIASAGLALTVVSWALPPVAILHDWLVPPALLLLGYWSSGHLFVAPMPRVERALLAIDAALRVRKTAAVIPRLWAELLEGGYAIVYALIPMALIIHFTIGRSPDPARFWSVILITDYVCFAFLPWVQTRPPRSLESADPWVSRLRTFNKRVVDGVSIRVNTCPSGHAAEPLAAALLVLDAPPVVIFWMFLAALAVSAGAVYGRYHYAVDIVTGWAVAIVVWAVM